MAQSDPDVEAAADALVIAVAGDLGRQVAELTSALHGRLLDEIDALRTDPVLLDPLAASIESNLEEFARIVRYGLPMPDASPSPAADYARRLAQRGTDPSALLRAYRLGLESALLWTMDRIATVESNRAVAQRASRRTIQVAFQYVDAVSAQVLTEYESERVRWLANSNSLRRATLTELLTGPVTDIATAEASLGYRLRQHHVAAVLWLDRAGSPDDLRALEILLVRIGRQIGVRGPALFVPQDRSSAWGWLPLGRSPHPPVPVGGDLLDQLDEAGASVALGVPAAGVEGFRSTHLEARKAQELALVPHNHARRITSWSDPDVRAATLLLHDWDATKRLVSAALGELAVDSEAAARLRQTLRTFLEARNSYAASAAVLNVHKNTVRYRVDKAIALRGRPLEQDRLDLELALIACEWLGPRVLRC